MTDKISTSMLARSRPSKTGMELFKDLEHYKFIKRDKDKKAVLTNKGLSAGGSYASKDGGSTKYIVWPEDIVFSFESANDVSKPERASTEYNNQPISGVAKLKAILYKKN